MEKSPKHNELWELMDVLKRNEVPTILSILREPLLKLSETRISKVTYNTWKREGILKSVQEDSIEKKWQRFSILDLVILEIINILWNHDVSVPKINNLLTVILDATGLKNQIDDILNYPSDFYSKPSKDESKLELLQYLVQQRLKNPHLPLFTNLESFILGALKIDRPFSILLFETGDVTLYTTDYLSARVGTAITDQYFRRPFINISIDNILRTILSNQEATTLNFRNKLVEKLISNGYDIGTVNELLGERTDLVYEEKVIMNPQTESIANLIKEHSNQDILIKVRNSVKKSIRQLIIKKNN